MIQAALGRPILVVGAGLALIGAGLVLFGDAGDGWWVLADVAAGALAIGLVLNVLPRRNPAHAGSATRSLRLGLALAAVSVVAGLILDLRLFYLLAAGIPVWTTAWSVTSTLVEK